MRCNEIEINLNLTLTINRLYFKLRKVNLYVIKCADLTYIAIHYIKYHKTVNHNDKNVNFHPMILHQ